MEKITPLILSFFFFSFSELLFAQEAPLIEWQISLGGTGFDNGRDAVETNDHGFVVVGYTDSNDDDVNGNHGDHDAWAVKLSSSGSIVWQKCLGGSNSDEAQAVEKSNDGGYFVAGFTTSSNGDVSGNLGSSDLWITKLDADGVLVSQKCFGGSGIDRASDIKQTADGGLIVVGISNSQGGDVSGNHGLTDIWLVKLDAANHIKWQKCYGGTKEDVGSSIHQTVDKGYIIAGYTTSTDGDAVGNHGDEDALVIKVDSIGNVQWEKCIGGTDHEIFQSVVLTPDGGYACEGNSKSHDGDINGNHGNNDHLVVKLDANGNILWQRCLGGTKDDCGLDISVTSDGGLVEIGHSYSKDYDAITNHEEGKPDFLVVKLSAEGDVIWEHCYGGNDAQTKTGDNPYAILSSSDDGYLMVGRSDSNDGDVSGNHGGVDIWAVKLYSNLSVCEIPQTLTTTNITNSSAQLNWNAAGGAESYKVKYKKIGSNQWINKVTASTSLTVNGLLPNTKYTWQVKSMCQSNTSSNWSSKINFTTSVLRIENAQLIAFTCYPNPASTTVTFTFDLPKQAYVTIEVFNLIYQKMEDPVNSEFDEGLHQVEVSVKKFPPGIYFVKMHYDRTEITEKLVVD